MTEQEVELMMEELRREAQNIPEDFVAWHWYGLVEKLAGGDITKIKAVEEQNIIDCLVLLSYWDRRDKEQARQVRKQREQSNLQKLRF